MALEYLWRRRRDANWLSETGAGRRGILKRALHDLQGRTGYLKIHLAYVI